MDIRQIKELPGHESIKTTGIDTHLTDRQPPASLLDSWDIQFAKMLYLYVQGCIFEKLAYGNEAWRVIGKGLE